MVFLLAVPVTLVFVFGGKLLIRLLFGAGYIESYLPLIILCMAQLVNAFTGSVGLLLIMTGKQKFYTKVITILAILNVLISVPFVIKYGSIGAAIVFALFLAIQNIYLSIYVKRKYNYNTTIL